MFFGFLIVMSDKPKVCLLLLNLDRLQNKHKTIANGRSYTKTGKIFVFKICLTFEFLWIVLTAPEEGLFLQTENYIRQFKDTFFVLYTKPFFDFAIISLP